MSTRSRTVSNTINPRWTDDAYLLDLRERLAVKEAKEDDERRRKAASARAAYRRKQEAARNKQEAARLCQAMGVKSIVIARQMAGMA